MLTDYATGTTQDKDRGDRLEPNETGFAGKQI